MAKTVQNLARFLTTFDFDREYLRNLPTNPKSEKYVDQLQPLPRRTKKDRELWSTNEKVIDVHIDPPKWETIFRPLRGDVPSNFYTR